MLCPYLDPPGTVSLWVIHSVLIRQGPENVSTDCPPQGNCNLAAKYVSGNVSNSGRDTKIMYWGPVLTCYFLFSFKPQVFLAILEMHGDAKEIIVGVLVMVYRPR